MIEFDSQDNDVFNEIMNVLDCYPAFERLEVKEASPLSLPGLEIYPGLRKVYCNGKDLGLTVKEYEVLKLLAEHRGKVFTYAQICEKVWNDFTGTIKNSTINFHVNNLKRKILSLLPEAKFKIDCVRGVGYGLNVISE